MLLVMYLSLFCFFFNDTATTEIYTLSLHDALPICARRPSARPTMSEPSPLSPSPSAPPDPPAVAPASAASAAGAAAAAAAPTRPQALGPMPDRGRNRKARVVTAAGISAAVLVAGGGAVSYATSRSPAPTYVTAAAGSHSVMATLQATGTTEPSSAATVSFAVPGTVATVPVTMGQKVTAGEVLATLDTTSLKYALATAQGQVANANLTLSQAESGQVSAATTTGST